MIIRIVRMTFDPEKIDAFLEIFSETKGAIRNVEGCRHLELLRDIHHPNILTTLSHWDSHDDLDNYRTSDLFKNVWGRVKPLFSRPTEAFSLEKFIEV
jgi:quinol monooxygenase YgiN